MKINRKQEWVIGIALIISAPIVIYAFWGAAVFIYGAVTSKGFDPSSAVPIEQWRNPLVTSAELMIFPIFVWFVAVILSYLLRG